MNPVLQFSHPFLFSLNASRTSSRSLGAPRTTTPLAIDMTETIVSDHQSTPNLTYNYQEGARQNGTPQSESASSPPSSTPVTPKHDNSRITIHKGQSSSSITYEYTVTEDHQRQVSPTETNKGGSGDHDVSSAAEVSIIFPIFSMLRENFVSNLTSWRFRCSFITEERTGSYLSTKRLVT